MKSLLRNYIIAFLATMLLAQSAYAEFLLGPDDRVFVGVYNITPGGDYNFDSALSAYLIVDPDGNVQVPLVGSVRVSGLSPDDAASAVEAELATYIKTPSVTIRPSFIASRRVMVLGEVYRPGVYPINAGETIIEILAYSGGILPSGLAWNIKIIRGGLDDPQIHNVNINNILNNGDFSQNIQLMPGDIVFIPKTLMSRANDIIRDVTPLMTNLFLLTGNIDRFK